MHDTPSSFGLFGPPAWRFLEDGPRAEDLLDEQRREEDAFCRLMEEASSQDCPYENLVSHALKLSHPDAEDEELRRMVENARERLLKDYLSWHERVDADGNPCWISLTLPERGDDGEIRPGDLAPPRVLPPEDEIAPEKPRPRTLGQRLFSVFSDMAALFRKKEEDPVNRPAREHAGKGSIDPPKPHPIQRVVRLLLLLIMFYFTYKLMVRHGFVPKIL